MQYRGVTWLLVVVMILITFARPQVDIQTACTARERFRSSWGIITSPNFPRPYSANLSCTWVITTAEGSTVSFNFTTFDVTSGDNCNRGRCGCDYVEVRGQDALTPKGQFRTKYCNNNKPPSVLSLFTNKVRLHFRTTNQGAGFSLTYTSHDHVVKATATSWKAFFARNAPELTTRSGHLSTVKPITTRNSEEEDTTNSKSTNTTLVTPRAHFSPRISNGSKNGDKFPGTQESKASFNPSVSTARAPLDGAGVGSTAGSVVLFVEEEEKEEYVNDIVVLGPSLPIIFIFVAVVAGIAWWNFISDRREYNRIDRYGRFWRYFRRGKHGNSPPESRGVQTSTYTNKKRRGSLKEVRTQNLYTDMMRNWKGGQAASSATPYQPYQRRVTRTHSFGGRLTAFQENSQQSVARTHSFGGRPTMPKKNSALTPMPTPPDSMVAKNVDKPVETGQEAGSTSHVTPSNSRPPSVLLRDTLSLLFGTSDSLEGDSKPGSKRVSFAKELLKPTTLQSSDMNSEEVPLLQEEKNQGENLAYSVDARPMQIPSIVVERSGVPNLDATRECPATNANHADLLVPNTTHELLAKEEIFPDLEDFLLNLDKDLSLDDPPYSCAHHVRDILRQSYGAAEDAHSLSWEVLTVPDEFLEMLRSPEQMKQFEDVEEVD